MTGARWWVAAGLVGSAGLAVRRLLVVVTVHGGSMQPTYAAGDTVLGVRCRRPGRGRPVVFRPPDRSTDPTDPPYHIKRVVAVSGDPTPPWVPGGVAGQPVPAAHLVVRGDADGSKDSRHYGYVHERDVLAVVVPLRRRRQPRVPASTASPTPSSHYAQRRP